MKVYLVNNYNYENNHIFSTLDKAKEYCCNLAERSWEQSTPSFEEQPFDKNDVTFIEGKNYIYVGYNYDDIAIIIPYELDEY